MKILDFHPKQKWGQNFLINSGKIKQIILAVKQLKPSFIMEVGPGLGALTHHLLKLKTSSLKSHGINNEQTDCSFKKTFFSAVELDSQLCRYWENQRVSILKGDVLKIPWQSILLPGSVLTGNLPYSSSSRLLIQCCPGPEELKGMVLMFQKEVAERIRACAHSKPYGMLSVLAHCYWSIQLLTTAGTKDFYPQPKVAGQVLVFQKKSHNLCRPEQFLNFVKHCFNCRRKYLINSLQQALESARQNSKMKLLNDLKLKGKTKKENKTYLLKNFSQLGLSSQVRPEQLSPVQYVKLYKQLFFTE